VSALRGHPADAAAKCIALIVKIGKMASRFVLDALRANARGDAAKIKSLCNGAEYAGFAATDIAQRLPGN
jgi:Ala-tRNA(Pro) deacylase